MAETIIPEKYKPKLDIYDTQCAIDYIKLSFSSKLRDALDLRRVSAPLFVLEDSGLNDNLNGVERPVEFDIPSVGKDAQIVHSLAKWKRMALSKYGFPAGVGLYADMNAVRRDEILDNIHSVYVDQWDWEKVITKEERNTDYLKETVKKIVSVLYETNEDLKKEFPSLGAEIDTDISFITSQELEDLFPELAPHERENAYVRDHRTTFLMQIGGKLKSGRPHDGRAPDYDDWALNGDILVWNDVLERAFEISSMGIRVDSNSLKEQLLISGCTDRLGLEFHKDLIEGRLPLTIGGGIGQSRICMLMMECAHIGEVQSSVWDPDTIDICSKHGIILL